MKRKDYREIAAMPFGVERRKQLLAYLAAGHADATYPGVGVNGRHQLILKRDPDLRALLKKGILVRRRKNQGGKKMQTVLFLAESRHGH